VLLDLTAGVARSTVDSALANCGPPGSSWSASRWYGYLSGPALVLAVAHLAIAAIWLGSMSYSLSVVQPRSRLSSPTSNRREEF